MKIENSLEKIDEEITEVESDYSAFLESLKERYALADDVRRMQGLKHECKYIANDFKHYINKYYDLITYRNELLLKNIKKTR